MHSLGGKHIIRCVDRDGVTAPFVPRVPLIKDLLEAQDYIETVECSEEKVDINLVPFRRWHSAVTTLVAANASEYQMQTGKTILADGSIPWMKVEPDTTFSGKIIIARSPRYNNFRFPWKQVVEHYGARLIFVGLPEEHSSFVAGFGFVPYLRVKDFLELAKIIAGASLFIGNQSSPHAIALALGVDIISEVCPEQPDCVYPRKNVQYVCDGEVTLPDIGGSGTLYCPAHVDIPPDFNTSMVPPNYWQYPNLPASTHFGIQKTLVAQAEKCSEVDAGKKLYIHNARRCPRFFNGTDTDPLHLYRLAHRNAFHSQETVLKPII